VSRYQNPDRSKLELRINLTPVERVLVRAPGLALGEYRCPVDHAQFGGGGPQLCHYIVFPRRPVTIQIEGGQPEVAAPGTTRFYNIGDQYRRFAIGAQSDESDWIALSEEALRSLVESLPGSRDGAVALVKRAAPASARLCLAQRRLFASIRHRPIDRLAFEERGFALAQCALTEAACCWSRGGHHRTAVGSLPAQRRRRIAERTKELLSLDPSRELSLVELAREVGCSLAHLSRLFREHTGTTLHAFRQQIRLHRALELLDRDGWTLADVAAELGFVSHSHFTLVFRRNFGILPSHLRGAATRLARR
jgi:AraC family transcriptional regulator